MKATRRQFLKIGAVVGAGALLPLSAWRAFASVTVPQTPLPGASIPQFAEPLTTFVGRRVTSTGFGVSMREFHQKILPDSIYSTLALPFNQAPTYGGIK